MRVPHVLAIACVAAGCVTGRAGQAGPSTPITQAELIATETTSLYDALRELRSRWLQQTVDAPETRMIVRRGDPIPPNAIQCNAMAYVGSESASGQDLRRLLVVQVAEVRLIPARATRPDGSRCSHNQPAIHVVLVDGG